jgi:K+-transporting ATPase A subunit
VRALGIVVVTVLLPLPVVVVVLLVVAGLIEPVPRSTSNVSATLASGSPALSMAVTMSGFASSVFNAPR